MILPNKVEFFYYSYPQELFQIHFSASDMSGNHSMIICSEEQFKVLSLPQLRVKHKEKLTATDGSKVRKLGVITLNNKQGRSQVGRLTISWFLECMQQLYILVLHIYW